MVKKENKKTEKEKVLKPDENVSVDESVKKDKSKKNAEKESNEAVLDPVEELKEEVLKLKEENASLKDQMLRRQAETDNFRKRLIRDKEESVQYANTALIKDLLMSLDNLDRAIDSANKTQDIKALIEGVGLVKDNLYSTLEKSWGLKEIKAEGKEFNPEYHEACMMVEDENCKKEVVLQELQKGYSLHDRVIRPTKVKVGKPKN